MEPGFDLNATMLQGILISGFLKMSLLKLDNSQIRLWIQIKVNFINSTPFNCTPIFFGIQSTDTCKFSNSLIKGTYTLWDREYTEFKIKIQCIPVSNWKILGNECKKNTSI